MSELKISNLISPSEEIINEIRNGLHVQQQGVDPRHGGGLS